jgi:hypothetical protein
MTLAFMPCQLHAGLPKAHSSFGFNAKKENDVAAQ